MTCSTCGQYAKEFSRAERSLRVPFLFADNLCVGDWPGMHMLCQLIASSWPGLLSLD